MLHNKTQKSLSRFGNYCFSWTLLLGVSLILLTGCKTEKRPEGLPELFPCTVTLTQENAPLEGATVLAIPEDPALARWPISGITDAEGKVSFATYGKFKGIPEGSYTLIVTKEEVVEQEGSKKEIHPEDEKHQGEVNFFDLVDPKFSDVKSSPCKIKVEKKDNHFDFDTGKKMRKAKAMARA